MSSLRICFERLWDFVKRTVHSRIRAKDKTGEYRALRMATRVLLYDTWQIGRTIATWKRTLLEYIK